jgi:hypothetical protein
VPAAAVIPALIAYIKVVAVKKLVVGFWARVGSRLPSYSMHAPFCLGSPRFAVVGYRPFTLKKLECSKQAIA